MFELAQQLANQSEIIESIKNVKKDIVEKQIIGRQISLAIADPEAEVRTHMKGAKINNLS